MSMSSETATQVAREYYNSSDADHFYSEIWGGEDIHIGLYESDAEPIKDASRRTVDHLLDRIGDLNQHSTVIDVGSGYGGAARRMVERFGCRVTCVNLSETENARNRRLNEQAGVADRIDVVDGSFEELPFEGGLFDAAWSQDAILHAGNRPRVLGEVDRVLKPGGRFVFTDPMQSNDCPDGVLDPILARIHLADLGSPKFYQGVAEDLGWNDLGFEDLTDQLVNHYARVLQVTEDRQSDLNGKISDDYLERMKTGLQHWVDGGRNGHLSWGVFLFGKP
ncbi:Sarcosine/dimethylglycine N-methyltransferase [Stieleria neptunia]|uniref:Sarcosine/dimethylglycine N-methyltransferase n=2 Tax=Stieleria neptunia TaxID=2527979 RepID=A0A518HPL3_9BACT|nr:Sarcosine/dimethylglycine N-methyltransferase [Stieleria neptunia]